MNYKKYFIFEPGKATCRQENCPKQLVLRKQGNTSGMRFHLKKYHSNLLEEEISQSADNNTELSISSLISTYDPPIYNPTLKNPICFETIQAGPAASSSTSTAANNNDFYEYQIDGAGYSMNDSNDQKLLSESTSYDVKTELMDMLFKGSSSASNNLESGNDQSYLEEHRNEEAQIPQKRPRNDFVQSSSTGFDLHNPIDYISYGFPPSEESLPSPSAQQYAFQNSTKKARYQFTEADKHEIKNRIKKKEVDLFPVTGNVDIMSYVVEGTERIAVYCSVCGGILSAKGGGSITYHRNACSKLSDPARIQSHPFSAEMKKKLQQKCLNLVTNDYFPGMYFNEEKFLDLLQFVHNLGFNFGVESARSGKDEITYGPAVMSEAMPNSSELQKIIDQTILQNSSKFADFIHQNINDSGGALSVEKIDKYCNYLGFTFHLITKDWKFLSIPISLKEYPQPPTSVNIDEDAASLIKKYNLTSNNVIIISNEETESKTNRENSIKNASNFLMSVLEWILNPENESFHTVLDDTTIDNLIAFVKLVDTVKEVIEYTKSKPNVFAKFEASNDGSNKIFLIKQFSEMSVQDYDTIQWHLKADQQSQLLNNFYFVKQRYQEFQRLWAFLTPFLTDIKTLDGIGKPTLYKVPIIYESLIKNFNKYRNVADKLIAGFSEAAYLYLEFVKDNLIMDEHYIALFLNPKLNGQLETFIEQEDLDKLMDKITIECNKVTVEKTEQEEPTPKKFSSLRKRQRTENTTFQTELDEYLAIEISENDQSFELLEWWKCNSTRFPRLSKIAKKYHSIPASCVSEEDGAFGILKKLNENERIGATSEMLSKMLEDTVAAAVAKPSTSTPSKTSSSPSMQPFHPGLVHNYQTLIAKCHSCLSEMNYAKLSAQDAAIIDYHIAIITESLNKLLQQIAVASKSSFAMVNSDAGIRTKTSIIEALDILKRYKEAYAERCKDAREQSKEIPIFDGTSTPWPEFWSRFKYFVGDSPLPAIEKFHILSKHLAGKAKALISSLSFENESYQEAVTLLANFSDNK